MSKLKKALEKAKETRKGAETASEASSLQTVSEELFEHQPDRKEASNRQDINPVYQRTKILEVNSPMLKKNKIVTLFPENKMTDQLKILRTQILNRMKELKGNSLLITSPRPREGKTFIASNLAVSISLELDRTIMLVDADLREPEIHRYFGFDVTGGLSDHLVDKVDIAEVMVNPGIDKLTILPAGKSLPNSSELLGAPRMESLVKEMKERYAERFIIFDSSSILTSADPLAFSRFIDGVLLVIEAEKTSAKDIKRTMELLKEKPVVGTVFNKAKA